MRFRSERRGRRGFVSFSFFFSTLVARLRGVAGG